MRNCSRIVAAIGACLAAASIACFAAPIGPTISHGHFSDVAIFRPANDPRQFVLLLSGSDGITPDLGDVAQMLAAQGAMVAVIDTSKLEAWFIKNENTCFFPDGDLENLSHYIQAYYKLPTYLVPILVGYSSGATIAEAMITQAAPDIFTGAVLIDAGDSPQPKLPLCKPQLGRPPAASAPLANPRIQRVNTLDPEPAMPQVLAAYKQEALLRPRQVRAPASLSDLPIIEMTADSQNDVFAVFLSGDGGWAGIDKKLGGALARRGIPIAGIDSLRYFWTARTPAGLAADLERVLQYYARRWNKQRAVLIGYSQGADTLPFALNRLSADAKRMVSIAVLLALSGKADFEFHLSNWISPSKTGFAVLPEMMKLTSSPPTLCVYGADDSETLCPRLHGTAVRLIKLNGGHHFDGEYEHLADVILKAIGEP